MPKRNSVWKMVVRCEVNDDLESGVITGRLWRRKKAGYCQYCGKAVAVGDLVVSLFSNPDHPDYDLVNKSYRVLHPACYDEIRIADHRQEPARQLQRARP